MRFKEVRPSAGGASSVSFAPSPETPETSNVAWLYHVALTNSVRKAPNTVMLGAFEWSAILLSVTTGFGSEKTPTCAHSEKNSPCASLPVALLRPME